MSNLLLHPTKGLNPHMCCCPQCGQYNGALALIGRHDKVGRCRECARLVFGLGKHGDCRFPEYVAVRPIEERERIPTWLCKTCEAEQATFAAVVADGGMYWRCPAGHSGVMKSNAITVQVREHLKLPTGPCGMEFDTTDCPGCTP